MADAWTYGRVGFTDRAMRAAAWLGSSAVGGAMVGAVAGSMVPGFGTIVGAGIGAANGVICGMSIASGSFGRPIGRVIGWATLWASITAAPFLAFGLVAQIANSGPASARSAVELVMLALLAYAISTLTYVVVAARIAARAGRVWPRAVPGACPACGYAVPKAEDGAVCSECGVVLYRPAGRTDGVLVGRRPIAAAYCRHCGRGLHGVSWRTRACPDCDDALADPGASPAAVAPPPQRPSDA